MLKPQKAPFFLKEDEIKNIENIIKNMTLDEKIGQLFCMTGMMTSEKELSEMLDTFHPGAFMYRSAPAKDVQNAQRFMQTYSKIPLLLAANLESGGNGVAAEGTYYAKQMQVAATADTQMAYRLGSVCCNEGGACGSNWAFAPIIDIDYNWRNPITNVRTYGSEPETVCKMAAAYIDGIRSGKYPMAECIKHFPGDGVDERDQHLMPTVNSLSCSEWEASYGKLYSTLIEKNVLSVMVGHIIQPHMTRKFAPDLKDNEIKPASTNKYIITDLLRGELGFEGLVTTDATAMVGYSAMDKRSDCLALSIAAGCDMLLFCKNAREDFESVKKGYTDGIITEERLYDALTHILAMKTALGLLGRKKEDIVPTEEELSVLNCEAHIKWAKECADEAITLVKDSQKLLPISPKKTRKIRMTVLGEQNKGGFGDNDKVAQPLKECLEKAGFEVFLYDYETLEHGEIFESGIEQIKEKFDLSLVVANVATASNHTTRRLDWVSLMAADEPWYVKDIPTMFVSFANPYHLVDIPFVSTFVNCYSSNIYCVEAFVDKITGNSEFKGKSPCNPFCGIWGAESY